MKKILSSFALVFLVGCGASTTQCIPDFVEVGGDYKIKLDGDQLIINVIEIDGCWAKVNADKKNAWTGNVKSGTAWIHFEHVSVIAHETESDQ